MDGDFADAAFEIPPRRNRHELFRVHYFIMTVGYEARPIKPDQTISITHYNYYGRRSQVPFSIRKKSLLNFNNYNVFIEFSIYPLTIVFSSVIRAPLLGLGNKKAKRVKKTKLINRPT